jgi:hypothetical protein
MVERRPTPEETIAHLAEWSEQAHAWLTSYVAEQREMNAGSPNDSPDDGSEPLDDILIERKTLDRFMENFGMLAGILKALAEGGSSAR